MPAKLASLLLWALAAGVSVFWWLRLSAAPPGQAIAAAPVAALQVNAQALAKALGAVDLPATMPVPASTASRYELLGVLAGRDSGAGAAVIAVGGKPAKPFRVGDMVEDGIMLQSLAAREARLGPGMDAAATTVLQLPRPAPGKH